MKYRRKLEEVEAFQWKGPDTDLPSWITDKQPRIEPANDYGRFQLTIDDPVMGRLHIPQNDWVSLRNGDIIYVRDPDIWALNYEPVP